MSKKQTILIVDDEKINVDFIVEQLQGMYNIKVAFNGEIALKILDKFEIDLVLLDVMMPVLDGYETIKQIKSQENLQDIPVIFLTSKDETESLVYGFELGARDYLTKPFNFEELKIRVKNHLETYNLKKRLEKAQETLEKLINSQDNMVLRTSGKEILFVNNKFYQFFGYKDILQFHEYHNCICEMFLENDKFFHLGKIKDGQKWIEVMTHLPHSQRIVSMVGADMKPHAFSVSINNFDDESYILNFADVTQTVLNNIELEDKIIHDKLTNAYNREFFEQKQSEYIKNYHNDEFFLGVALLDIDHFKSVNDTYGHDVGDEVLVNFVQTIQKYSRDEDILIRWGGEEFVMVLKVHSKEDLYKALDHLRKVIEMQTFPKIGQKTCSIGGTIYKENEEIQATIKRADEAVYEAKETGRNKVVVF